MSNPFAHGALYDVLCAHAAAYPAMEPTDAVKLIFQGVFGGGHLIADRAACAARLAGEYRETPQTEGPLCEVIEPVQGLVRVSLGALDAHGLTPEALTGAFIRSAARVRGTEEDFLSRLDVLRAAADGGVFAFDRPALDAYLAGYLAERPLHPVSHSAVYRSLYAPHYRVLLRDELPLPGP